jgi:hypothetical protein
MLEAQNKDLIVLVADRNIQATITSILNRHQAIGIRQISFDVYTHLHRDPGCRLEAHSFLQPFFNKYAYSMVLFDRQGCGEEIKSREQLEADVEEKLKLHGWENRSSALVLDPELEIWVWNDSPHVSEVLGWVQGSASLRDWLIEKNYLIEHQTKPQLPKEAMEDILRNVRKPRSSSIYAQLAERVSFRRCIDPCFQKLSRTLREWFSS